MYTGFWLTKDDYDSLLPTAMGGMDVGGINHAMRASGYVLLRPYFKGTPTPTTLAAQILSMDERVAQRGNPSAVTYYQVGNEPNLPEVEYWSGGRNAYIAFFKDVRRILPARIKLAWAGMSPGKPGYLDWYRPAEACGADIVCAHVYGQALSQLKGMLSDIENATAPLPIGIGECNFGPGPGITIDKDAWADNVWGPFLDHVDTRSAVLFALYFAWTWNADTPLATPVDARNTRIHAVTIRKALNDGANAVTPAYDPEPARAAIYTTLTRLQTTHVADLHSNGYVQLYSALVNGMESLKNALSLSKGER